jgi:hypothetical protein
VKLVGLAVLYFSIELFEVEDARTN